MIDVIRVNIDEKQILMNLLEKYQYEFSQWEKNDVDEMGLYNYEWTDEYFTEENSFAYFIKLNNQLIGFVLVNDYPEIPNTKIDHCISEFFIMYKYRRNGYGKEAVMKVFDKHHGQWQLKCHPKNIASVYFWQSVIKEYTKGNYILIENYPDPEVNYEDGTSANVFFFEN